MLHYQIWMIFLGTPKMLVTKKFFRTQILITNKNSFLYKPKPLIDHTKNKTLTKVLSKEKIVEKMPKNTKKLP